jgi:biopolymer transport protein ExbB
LGRVLAAGLRNAKSSREIMKESIEEAGRGVSHELSRYLTRSAPSLRSAR